MTDYTAINYRPLTDPDNEGAFRAFKQWARASKQPWAAAATLQIVLVVTMLGIIGLIILGLISSFVGAIAFMVSDSGVVATIFALLPTFIIVVIGTIILATKLNSKTVGAQWKHWYRTFHFAKANGLGWHVNSANPNYTGNIFQAGSSRTVYEHLTSTSGRFLDIGNFRYTTGSGKSQTTHYWGFMALKLDRRIPHCMLDALSNNGIFGSNMTSYSRDQRLSLEGDFDRYFTLYCPKEYERDALYIFTPDLMALLIDTVSAFDVEIVDDWMFIYSAKPWDMLNPWTWYRLFMIVHTVGRKTVRRTAYYRDERAMPPLPPGAIPAPPSAANNFVAPQGQRLKKRFPWTLLIILGVVFVGIPVVLFLMFVIIFVATSGGY